MKKVFIVIILLFFISGCNTPTNKQKGIYHDDKLIISEGDSYFSKKITKNSENEIELSAFTGSYTLWERSFINDVNINVYFKNDLKDGKFKIVLIKDDNIYETIYVDNSNREKSINYNLNNGHYKIKLIGINASVTLKYEINFDS